MKANEIRNCDGCNGPLVGNIDSGKTANFYRVCVENAIPNHAAIRERTAWSLMGLGGLSDVFATESELAQVVHMTELLLCFDCIVHKNLLQLCEQKNEKESQEEDP